ncbi:MAG: TetR/AcrR family transcriptional regulator [Actinobacteria bacterium]|nr:TetR/AcrR family transcriptional regulator [Actinomycetota bacterium]
MTEPQTGVVAIDGRPLGRRAQETRRRLLDATQGLLESRSIRDVRVVDIARAVGTSPATFYQYFSDVESAVLVLADEVADELDPIVHLLDEPWRGRAGLDSARQLVDSFVSYWDRYRAILRVRNLASEEGDARFRDVRIRTLSRITDRLRMQIVAAQTGGRVAPELQAYAAAAGLVAMLERMAAHHVSIEDRGLSRADLVETLARIIHGTVTGQR